MSTYHSYRNCRRFYWWSCENGLGSAYAPRTPEREEEPPPLTLLNQVGLPEKLKMPRILTIRMKFL